jgi:uncharacterized protein YwqG
MTKPFERILVEHGYGAQALIIRRYALPCVGFSIGERGRCPTGSSRFGGGPDAPRPFRWPMFAARPLDFLLQVNLRELAAHPKDIALPESGILTFFYDLANQPWGYDPEEVYAIRVLYFPEGTALERRSPQDPDLALEEAALSFWPALSIPRFGSRAFERLEQELSAAGGAEGNARGAYDKLSRDLFRAAAPAATGPSHRIGGHAENVQGDMQLEAQLVMNGLYCGDETGYKDPRRKELEKTCEEWSLLLQLDSDDDAELMWGDLGMLYSWARASDLRKGDFSRVWMCLQCG